MSQFVMEIVNYSYDPETKMGSVVAVLDDFILCYPSNYESPAEYGPGVGEANFVLDEEELPEDETQLQVFFEDLNLDWRQLDVSDCDD